MLNEKRIRLMTSLAFFEAGNGEKELKIASYKRKDYVSLNVLRRIILASILYMIVAFLVSVVLFGVILTNVYSFVFIIYGIILIVLYAICIAICATLSTDKYEYRHKAAQHHAKNYLTGLKYLEKMYEEEKNDSKRISEINNLKERMN